MPHTEQPNPRPSRLKAFLRSFKGRIAIYAVIGMILALISETLRDTEEVETLARVQAAISTTINDASPFAILNAQMATLHDVRGCLLGAVPAEGSTGLATAGVLIAGVVPLVVAPFLYAADSPTVIAQVTNFAVLLVAFVLTWRLMEYVFFPGDRLLTRPRRIATTGLLLVLSCATIGLPWMLVFIATKFAFLAISYTVGKIFNLAVLFLGASAFVLTIYKGFLLIVPAVIEATAHERLHEMLSDEHPPTLEQLILSAVERAGDVVVNQQRLVDAGCRTTLATNAPIRAATDPLVYGYTLGLARKLIEARGAKVDDKVSVWALDAVKARLRSIFPEIEWLFHFEREHKQEGDCGILLGLAEPHSDENCAALRILWTDLLRGNAAIEGAILTYYRQTIVEEGELTAIRGALRSIEQRYRDRIVANERHFPPTLVYGLATIVGMVIAVAVDAVLAMRELGVDRAVCTQWNAYVWCWVLGAAVMSGALAGTLLILFPPPWKRFWVLRWSLAAAAVLALASIGTSFPAESSAVRLTTDLARLVLALPAALAGAYLSEFFRLFRRRFI